MNEPEELGKIEINDDVIATIATLAAVEVPGIVHIAGGHTVAEVSDSKNLLKGVSVSTNDETNSVAVDLEVQVEYGADVYKAAYQAQRSVRNAVARMTGLGVSAINLRISGIVLGRNGIVELEQDARPLPHGSTGAVGEPPK